LEGHHRSFELPSLRKQKDHLAETANSYPLLYLDNTQCDIARFRISFDIGVILELLRESRIIAQSVVPCCSDIAIGF